MLMKVWLDSSEGRSGIQSKRNHTSLEKIGHKIRRNEGLNQKQNREFKKENKLQTALKKL